jgi:hypothetical protein
MGYGKKLASLECWVCHKEATHAIRDLHQVGSQDTYDEETKSIVVLTKPVWAPCTVWIYACNLHPLRQPIMYAIGQECPHGTSNRSVPVPNMPLIGKTAIVLETDLT